ncbi:MAG: hypothetical protein Fur006_46890 [Coleofasciculaceae cyanobacterium]
MLIFERLIVNFTFIVPQTVIALSFDGAIAPVQASLIHVIVGDAIALSVPTSFCLVILGGGISFPLAGAPIKGVRILVEVDCSQVS